MGERAKKQYVDVEYLLSLTLHLKREMCQGKTKLASCFETFPDKKHQQITKLLAKREYEGAIMGLHLPKDLKEKARTFFTYLGSEDTEGEALRCEQMIALLSSKEASGRAALKDKVKVARTAGVCIAGIVLLLFL